MPVKMKVQASDEWHEYVVDEQAKARRSLQDLFNKTTEGKDNTVLSTFTSSNV
jgi:hypothetical protein